MEATIRDNVSIIGRSFELTDETRHFIHRRITDRISRFRGVVRSVDVRITDVNGPKGGADKSCAVVARLDGGESLVVRSQSTTVQRALAKAVRILARQIATALRRNRWKRPRRR